MELSVCADRPILTSLLTEYGMFHGHTSRKLLKKNIPPKKQGGVTQRLPRFATPKYPKKLLRPHSPKTTTLRPPPPPKKKKKTPDHPRSRLQELPESQSWGL